LVAIRAWTIPDAAFGAGLAILTLRNVALDEEPTADATNSPELAS